MVTSKYSRSDNRLPAALPPSGRERLLAGCEQIELRSAEVLCRTGQRIEQVYFPIDSVVSLVTTLADGPHMEVGMVGYEGMVGASLILGVDTSPQDAVVQGAGIAWRMSAQAFHRHLDQNIELRRLLNRYMYVLMGQLAQTTACSHYHLVRPRLACWLLMTRDRARSNEFHLTQQFLAHMLGVRRVGVTNAASSMREHGLIDYRRGAVTILDRAGLERASCVCYRRANEIYEFAMGTPRPNAARRRRAGHGL